MKIPFQILYFLNLMRENLVKTIAIILIVLATPYLNSFEDIREEFKIDYHYQKDSKHFYVTISESGKYYLKSYNEIPKIKNGHIISYKYNDNNTVLWFVYIVLCLFPIVGIFTNDSNLNFNLTEVFKITISNYITCELEDGTYYYFYKDRFIGKSVREIHKEYIHIAYAFNLSGMSNIRNCPVWKTKSQNRESNLEKLEI